MATGTKPSASSAAELWGLTGGVASGKSSAARFFAEAGLPVLDADAISRELSSPGGAAFDAIVARFGTADRARLREIVFADAGARSALEGILHPLIRAESARRASAFSGPVIYEAALLVESGRARELAGLIVVDAPASVRRARLVARDRCTGELADRIISAQAGDAERIAAASVVLRNIGSLDELRAQVVALVAARGW
jgi:dephospho-CoA kinase